MLAPFDMRLDLAQLEVFPGDYIDATLVVDSGKTAKATISVWLEARLHGKGNTHRETFVTDVVFDGEVTEGTHRYPVSLHVPNGPFTYQGQTLNLTWMMCARADVPWAIDPKCERDFLLSYRPTGMELVHVPHADFGEIAPTQKGGSSVNQLGLVIMGAAGFLVVIGAGLSAVSSGTVIPLLVFGAMMALFAVLTVGNAARKKAAEVQLGPVSLDMTPASPGPGETVTVTCVMQPPKAVLLNQVTCEITAVERVVRGSGTNRTTYTENIFTEWIPLEGGAGHVDANERKVLSTSFDIPADAPLSFSFPDNTLEWSFKFHIDIPSWPDWVQKSVFNVLPNPRLLDSEQDSPVASQDAPAEGLW